MMTAADEGFNFASLVDNDADDDADNFSIDYDSFLQILNEAADDNSVPSSNDLFYSPTKNSLDCGPVAHVDNRKDLLLDQDHCVASESNVNTAEGLKQLPCISPTERALSEANYPSLCNSSYESDMGQLPSFVETNHHPITHGSINKFDVSVGHHPITHGSINKFDVSAGFPDQNLLDGASCDFTLTNEPMISSINDDVDNFWPCPSWSENKIALEAQVEDANMTFSQVPTYNFFRGMGPDTMNCSFSVNNYDSSSSTTTDEASAETYLWGLKGKPCENQVVDLKDESAYEGFECKPFDADKEGALGDFSFASAVVSCYSSHGASYSLGVPGDASVHYQTPVVDQKPMGSQLLEEAKSVFLFDNSFKKEGIANSMVQLVNVKSDQIKSTQSSSRATLSEDGNDVGDDDDDICIIEDINQPRRIYKPLPLSKSLVTSQCSLYTPQCSTIVPCHSHMGVSGTRLKANDERLIFQLLVQDLSQPKSEASPPDGVLSVPLLRHQRIALSWMVNKETTSWQCSGGILADDQGLGKTVSTIALILSERAPSRTLKSKDTLKLETLDLDEDADNQTRNDTSMSGVDASSAKGRPSGGTLIVCPTSVLRQWAEELHNKVTGKADLSVLVYHGSNRTKDPNEVAKFDVVLTTYSIVSMEVPRQPVVVKDGNDKRNPDADDEYVTSNKKRKHSNSSDKKRCKKGTDNELLDSVTRPLARVRWFRVVLDEAQSIKNYRTQVAQACWGLRAKRRWCLSGTPIQNAVDDLYSYFRFLKYDPYSVYNSFCSMVKVPISRNPASGYRKLQAVLKTIMLRRTKGTHLDGKPIITLPPKSVKLKKVEFSEEERAFYSKLEEDSRAQFQAYAESGTVKQNYVNILLLLLRLRQACDHPLLVQGVSSGSVWKSSVHMAKKLPQEQQIRLLNCLEASLAICHICSDPPEDAVVGICGHVFCNQCISERLSGDDHQCPATKCKTQLNVSSVFSIATLKSLSGRPCQDGTNICSASEFSNQGESVEPPPSGRFDSSKLKAALEVLQSLSKPQVSTQVNTYLDPVDSSSSLFVEANSTAASDVKSSDTSNGLNETNIVVKEKAIVFSQWTRMLDMLEASLKESSIVYRRLDGTMSVVARDKAVKDFNTLPEVTVMIMSLKAASLGLNMVAACHVLLLDLWWNPTTEDQAIDRAHRIGQTRPVTVLRLTVKDTVEDRILALQQRKRELVASAFGEDETGSRQTRLTVDDLKYLFMA